MNTNTFIILDFETDSSDAYTANPVQLASIMVHPRTLNIISDSEFNSFIQPPNINKSNYIEQHSETIQWHAKNYNTSSEEIISIWKNAPLQKDVWADFCNYLLRYHSRTKRKNQFSAPVLCGYNILNFDCIILDRLCKQYGNIDKYNKPNIFHPRDRIDLMPMIFSWFENFNEPTNYQFDTLRNYFGMSKDKAHDALTDVKQTAELLCRFLKFQRRVAKNTQFKNSFRKEKC